MTYSTRAIEDAAHISASRHTPPQLVRLPPAAAAPPTQQQPQRPPAATNDDGQQHAALPTSSSSARLLLTQTSTTSASATKSPPLNPACTLHLGVNRRTGRLQWFPACPYAKLMLLLPAALAPVALVLLVLGARPPAVSSARPTWPRTTAAAVEAAALLADNTIDSSQTTYAAGDSLDQLQLQLERQGAEAVRRGQCLPVRYALSELESDNTDRDVLRDIRTSFIPPDYVYTSAECVPRAVGGGGSGGVYDDNDVEDNGDEGTADADGADANGAEASMERVLSQLVAELNRAGEPGDILEDAERRGVGDRRQRRHATNVTTMLWKVLKEVSDDTARKPTVVPMQGSASQIRTAQSEVMRQYMDTSIDPCTNFYQYACGNWERLNTIPKDKSAFDTFEMLREKLDQILRELLAEPVSNNRWTVVDDDCQPAELGAAATATSAARPPQPASSQQRRRRRRRDALVGDPEAASPTVADAAPGDYDAEDKAKLLYQSCMAYDQLRERGVEPLLEFLRSLGGWPALEDDWQPAGFDWLNMTATLRQYNNDILIMLWIGADIKNSDANIMQFDQTNLGLPSRDYFLEASNERFLEAYAQFMRTTIEILGAKPARAAREADDIVRFERQLARIMIPPESRINISLLYDKLTLAELAEQVPQIDWLRYLRVVQGRPVAGDEVVVMYAMEYMRRLVDLLGRTDERTVANYLLWRFVRHRINNLDDRFQAAKQRFFYVLFGREESPERWKSCVSHVNTNMGMAVGAMFVRRYFDEKSKQDTLAMTVELQQAFRDILNTTEWLDAPTRHFAELKVNAMQLRIGYPDFILHSEELNGKFAGLRMERAEYFANTLRVLRHIARVEQLKLGAAINRTEWNTAPAIINAYYSRNKNQIIFPAGILQPPFYHRHFPRALNYGGIGVVIGHELTHGFDDKGRLFDMDGNMLRWWSDAAVEGFHQRARCLVAQYGNYSVPDVPGVLINGESTQGENIADNGGLKQAYRAYEHWLAENADDEEPDGEPASERMPGMELSARQLFFLNFAQVWCGAMRPEAALNKLKTAVHSPGIYRVIGSLRNSVEFADVYGCAAGTPMNPVDKCRVW